MTNYQPCKYCGSTRHSTTDHDEYFKYHPRPHEKPIDAVTRDRNDLLEALKTFADRGYAPAIQLLASRAALSKPIEECQ